MMMKFEALAEVLREYDDKSRVWIYTADRPIKEEDTATVDMALRTFAKQWISHNKQLKAFGGLIESRFAILVADESQAGASGCSIDSSVRFIKQLGQELNIDFFNRMLFSYKDGEAIRTVQRSEFEKSIGDKALNGDTLVVDTLVSTKGDLISTVFKPLKNSWHARLVDGIN